jgi:AmmeMemoRadiSam system protein A
MALTAADGAELTRRAAAAVAGRLTASTPPADPPESAALHAVGATFVTLTAAGELRGCIGSLDPVRPLYLDVARNAVKATADPRLPAVTPDEWPKLDISVSVLSPAEPIAATNLAELTAAVRPGEHGLIITDGVRRATFLPVVWAKLTEPAQFVAALLAKGGWPRGEWPPGLRAARYTATEFHSPAPRPPLG